MNTPHTHTHRLLAVAGSTALALALLAGCAASAKVDAQWVDPQFKGRSFAGQRVLVVCEASDQTLRRLCEDQLASEVIAFGGSVTRAPEGLAPLPNGAAHVPAAGKAGAVAVVRGVVAPTAQSFNPAPQVSFGIGGFGWGGGSSTSVGGGVGVSVPTGAGSVSTGYGIDLGITDVSTGKLVWSAKTTTPPSADIGAQMVDLARTSMTAARAAGVI
jgi:hypothetical protein